MKRKSPAVAGIADHSGWAVVVSVAARDGTPVVVDRRRVELLGGGLPRQPYHAAADLGPAGAEQLVAAVTQAVVVHARDALSTLQADLGPECALVSIALRAGPARSLPETVAGVLQSHPAMHAAEGALYRDALCAAAAELGVGARVYPRGKEAAGAARALGVDPARMEGILRHLGQGLGPPWQKEHRSAAAAAITLLHQHSPWDRVKS